MTRVKAPDVRTRPLPKTEEFRFVASALYKAWWLPGGGLAANRDLSFEDIFTESPDWMLVDEVDAALRWLVENKYATYVKTRKAYYGTTNLRGVYKRLFPQAAGQWKLNPKFEEREPMAAAARPKSSSVPGPRLQLLQLVPDL